MYVFQYNFFFTCVSYVQKIIIYCILIINISYHFFCKKKELDKLFEKQIVALGKISQKLSIQNYQLITICPLPAFKEILSWRNPPFKASSYSSNSAFKMSVALSSLSTKKNNFVRNPFNKSCFMADLNNYNKTRLNLSNLIIIIYCYWTLSKFNLLRKAFF